MQNKRISLTLQPESYSAGSCCIISLTQLGEKGGESKKKKKTIRIIDCYATQKTSSMLYSCKFISKLTLNGKYFILSCHWPLNQKLNFRLSVIDLLYMIMVQPTPSSNDKKRHQRSYTCVSICYRLLIFYQRLQFRNKQPSLRRTEYLYLTQSLPVQHQC